MTRRPAWLTSRGFLIGILSVMACAVVLLWVTRWPSYDIAKVSPDLRKIPLHPLRVQSTMMLDGGSRVFIFTYPGGRHEMVMVGCAGKGLFGPERFTELRIYFGRADFERGPDVIIKADPDSIGYLGELVRNADKRCEIPDSPSDDPAESDEPVENFRIITRNAWEMYPYLIARHPDRWGELNQP